MNKTSIIFRKILAVLLAVGAFILINDDYNYLGVDANELVYIGYYPMSRGLIALVLLFFNAYIIYRLVDARLGFVRLLIGFFATLILINEDWGLLHSFLEDYGLLEASFESTACITWLCIYLLLGLVFRPRRKEEGCLPVAAASAPVASSAQPLYEETTVTCPIKSKAFSKALVPYIKDGWKVEKITTLDRKNRLVYLKRKK